MSKLIAQKTVEDVIGKIEPPEAIKSLGPGAEGLNTFLNKTVELIYIAASIIFIFMVILSALQWIMSGGDKEAIKNARERLTWAIIGIVVLATAFLIVNIIGQITGFQFFAGGA